MKKIVLPLLKNQKNSDKIVISSKLSFYRNIDALIFSSHLQEEQKEKLEQQLLTLLAEYDPNLVITNFKDSSQKYINQLQSDLILHPRFLNNSNLVIAQHEGQWILLPNIQDHISLYTVEYGLKFKDMYKSLNSLLVHLDDHIHFSFNPELGYLTSNIQHMGNGLEMSVLLNLTGMELQNSISLLEKTAEETGYILDPYLNANNTGLFILKNSVSYGIKESDHIEHMTQFIHKIQATEELAKQELIADQENLEIFMLQVQSIIAQTHVEYHEMIHLISLIDFLDKSLYVVRDRIEWFSLIFRLTDQSNVFSEFETLEEINKHRAQLVQHHFNQLIKYKK